MSSNAEIVLIDDDLSFVVSVREHFNLKNIKVLTINDPKIAAALDYSRFRVVLLDIDMPEISGMEILREIRRSDRPLVIMVSGHSDATYRLACLSSGADFFFSKPVDLEELRLVAARAAGRTLDHLTNGENWLLSRSKCALRSPDGRTFGLTMSEFRVLEVLLREAPNPVAKAELASCFVGAGNNSTSFTRSLEVMISRIRSRVGSDDFKFPVKSFRNYGYVFHGAGLIES